jgi:DNA-binding beta-propeller fold protein YncE
MAVLARLCMLLGGFLAAPVEARYEHVGGWPQPPAGWSFTMTSNISGDSRGRVYVANRGDHPIMVFDAAGKFLTSLGEPEIYPSMAYDLTVSPYKPISVKRWVHGIHVDPKDNVWITDLGRHVIMKFSPQGKLLLTLGTFDKPGESPTNFFAPSSVAVARSGAVYVADGYGNSRIVQFTSAGKYVRAWGKKGSGHGEFDTPHCVSVDDRGKVYVAERMNNRVQVFDPDGRFLAIWPDLDRADAVFIRDGFAYVGTGREKGLYKYTLDGKRLGQLGPNGAFGYTHGIYLDRHGVLYTADPIAEDAHQAPRAFAPRTR